jgi:hypothetical protein
MQEIRRRLAWIAAAWLFFHATALGAAPFAMACVHDPAVAEDEEDACCRGLGPGQICPMHKHRGGSHGQSASGSAAPGSAAHQGHGHHAMTAAPADAPQEPASPCAMRSLCDPLELAIESLLTSHGVIPRAVPVTRVIDGALLPAAAPGRLPSRSCPPDLRPPRA